MVFHHFDKDPNLPITRHGVSQSMPESGVTAMLVSDIVGISILFTKIHIFSSRVKMIGQLLVV
jgi:hypothetical protein